MSQLAQFLHFIGIFSQLFLAEEKKKLSKYSKLPE